MKWLYLVAIVLSLAAIYIVYAKGETWLCVNDRLHHEQNFLPVSEVWAYCQHLHEEWPFSFFR